MFVGVASVAICVSRLADASPTAARTPAASNGTAVEIAAIPSVSASISARSAAILTPAGVPMVVISSSASAPISITNVLAVIAASVATPILVFIASVKSPTVGALVRLVAVVIVPAVILVVLAIVPVGNVAARKPVGCAYDAMRLDTVVSRFDAVR